MAPQKKDVTGLIAGPLKITARTDRKDRIKRVVFVAECVCGATEYGALAVLDRFQGHGLTCPGHPLNKSNEKPGNGFTYSPDQPEYDDALTAWESARYPDQPQEDSAVDCSTEQTIDETATIPEVDATEAVNASDEVVTTSEDTTATETVTADDTAAAASEAPSVIPDVTQETLNESINKEPSTKMSAVLAKRLKLVGYHTTSTKLLHPVKVLGLDAVNVVFADNAEGTDKVLLHVSLVSADGKKSTVSSRKKVADAEWSALSAALTGMQITWREKDQSRISVSK